MNWLHFVRFLPRSRTRIIAGNDWKKGGGGRGGVRRCKVFCSQQEQSFSTICLSFYFVLFFVIHFRVNETLLTCLAINYVDN